MAMGTHCNHILVVQGVCAGAACAPAPPTILLAKGAPAVESNPGHSSHWTPAASSQRLCRFRGSVLAPPRHAFRDHARGCGCWAGSACLGSLARQPRCVCKVTLTVDELRPGNLNLSVKGVRAPQLLVVSSSSATRKTPIGCALSARPWNCIGLETQHGCVVAFLDVFFFIPLLLNGLRPCVWMFARGGVLSVMFAQVEEKVERMLDAHQQLEHEPRTTEQDAIAHAVMGAADMAVDEDGNRLLDVHLKPGSMARTAWIVWLTSSVSSAVGLPCSCWRRTLAGAVGAVGGWAVAWVSGGAWWRWVHVTFFCCAFVRLVGVCLMLRGTHRKGWLARELTFVVRHQQKVPNVCSTSTREVPVVEELAVRVTESRREI